MKIDLFILLMIGIWIGMLLGISFLEAPLKFQAPNVSTKIGLGIGQLVFNALNRFEIICTLLLSFWLLKHFGKLDYVQLFIFIVPIVLVALQTLILLPALDARVELIMKDMVVPSSNHHLYYVLAEVTKVCFLVIGFVKIYPHE